MIRLDRGTLEGSEPLVLLETVTEVLGTLRFDVVSAQAANAGRFEASSISMVGVIVHTSL